MIQQLTEALQQSVINREELQHQSEYFSEEIIKLKNQLSETAEILNKNKSNLSAQKLSITNTSVQNANPPINANDSESSSMLSNEVQVFLNSFLFRITTIFLATGRRW